jgi:hypothetical protein
VAKAFFRVAHFVPRYLIRGLPVKVIWRSIKITKRSKILWNVHANGKERGTIVTLKIIIFHNSQKIHFFHLKLHMKLFPTSSFGKNNY